MNAASIARELLEALDHGATIPSVAERNIGFGGGFCPALAAHRRLTMVTPWL
jgi:hypothetical protein